MTKHFLEYSTTRVCSPMNDITGQSGIIDNNLGVSNSIKRQFLSNYIKDMAGRFSGSGAISDIKEMFN